MRKGEKRLFLGVLLILAAALILMAVQWARGGSLPRVYRVSVLLDGADGDYWKNLRAGMNRAALEHNVDLRFITRYEATATQADVLRTEWEGEADGVVIIPTAAAALSDALEGAPAALVVSVLGPTLESDRVNGYMAPDYAAVGEQLAEAALAAGDGSALTLYLTETPPPAALETAAALERALDARGVALDRVITAADAVLPHLPEGVLLAAEAAMTETLCAATEREGRVVGVGTSSRLLHYLEEGTAAALVVQSDYDAGYLAVSQVAARLTRERSADAVLESYTATGENMFQDPMIHILFATY